MTFLAKLRVFLFVGLALSALMFMAMGLRTHTDKQIYLAIVLAVIAVAVFVWDELSDLFRKEEDVRVHPSVIQRYINTDVRREPSSEISRRHQSEHVVGGRMMY